MNSGKRFLALVKVEDTGKKVKQTPVDSTNEGGAKRITAIELEGSSTMIESGE